MLTMVLKRHYQEHCIITNISLIFTETCCIAKNEISPYFDLFKKTRNKVSLAEKYICILMQNVLSSI